VRAARAAAGVVLALGLSACAGAPETNALPASSFSRINTDVFEPNCTFACHSGGEFAAGGLDMKEDPYGSLVRARPTAMECRGSEMLRVAPGKPDESLVYVKVRAKLDGVAPPCGEGMPSGANRAALDADDTEAIRAWIEAGAPDD
jgi:hypothetical protein